MIRLSPEELDKVWQAFVPMYWTNAEERRYIETSYARVTRNYSYGLKFEEWLFKHGGIVVQEKRKRYIEFFDESKATWFILKCL